MVADTSDCVMSLSLRTTVPVTFVKLPVTFEIPRWRTVNCAVECAGSMFQVEVCASADRLATRAMAETAPTRRAVFSMTIQMWPDSARMQEKRVIGPSDDDPPR